MNSFVNLSNIFLATSFWCMHEVVPHLASPRIQPFLLGPRRGNGCIRKLGVVSHIGMSIIHRCRDEVSEQDSSEEIFHLVAVFGKTFHSSGFHPQTQNLETSVVHMQLIKTSTTAKSWKEAFIGWVKRQSALFHFKQFQ